MGGLAPGKRLGADLTLVRLLGAGGLGEAWLAERKDGAVVVAKVLRPGARDERIALLERECRLARTLDHPAIVAVHGFGREEDLAWVTLEHVPGGDVGRLRGGPPAAVLRALLPVVDALAHAHARGIVHRDVKAANVLLGENGLGRLTDFGLALPLPSGPEVEALIGGGSRGSMSPQQLDGEPPNPGDDVYGLGALLYDLLQGEPAFWPDFDPRRVREERPPPLAPATPLPPRLPALVAAMLAKRVWDRPGLAVVRDELRAALAEVEAEAPPAAQARERPTTPPSLPGRRREIPLVPPPRPEALIAPAPLPASLGGTTHGRARSLRSARGPVLALFGVLAMVAVGVFVYLPRLVSRPPSPRDGVAPPTTAAPASPVESAPPAPPGEGTRPAPQEVPSPPPRADAAVPATSRSIDRRQPPPAPSPAAVEADAAAAAWSRAMSEGLLALERGEFAEARVAFTRAEAARPGTEGAADGLARAEDGLKANALGRHERQGQAAEAREEWRAALAEYDAALRLEPRVAFALEGRARSARRAELDERLEGFLKRADRLAANAVAGAAEATLDRAREAASAPRLARQVAALERALALARTPVSVRLLSDGRTEVTVLRIGRLGAFREKALDLRPGSYVVVGSRRGYRDARRTLVVEPGRSPEPLLVRCEEAL